ncbi:MAG: lysostaphin resistance A-like protein [Dermatophilaceae bacterium]
MDERTAAETEPPTRSVAGPRPARSWLRLLASLVLVVVGFVAINLMASPLFDQEAGYSTGLIGSALAYAIVYCGGILTLVWLICRLIDRRALSDTGIVGPPARAGRQLFGGVLVGAAMLGALFGIQVMLGFVRVTDVRWETAGLLAALGGVAVVVLVEGSAGFTEELVFRGYLMRSLGERVPVWVTVLPVTLIFALLHGSNSGFGVAWVLGALLLGTFLIATRLWSGALWFAIGWHAAWNVMQYGVVGLANVDDPPEYRYALLEIEQTGPSVLVGEGTSIEGGLLAILVVAIALTALLSRPEVRAALGRPMAAASDARR